MKPKILTVLLSIALSLMFQPVLKAQFQLIPYPAHLDKTEGQFVLAKQTAVYFNNPALKPLVSRLTKEWQSISEHPFNPLLHSDQAIKGSIYVVLNHIQDVDLGAEGYRLTIEKDGIQLSANSMAGIGYGLQTLSQLFDSMEGNRLDCVKIVDYPRFAYRGMHLDVVRHFMPIELVYKMLDELERHKMNVFHWHLTDDQGWRIEIKKYPELTKIGGFRENMEHLHWDERPLSRPDATDKIGGFYTQDEIAKVVAYAAERNINIIPEIELPAHAMAALAAFPELSCTGENLGVATGGVWPITHIFCAGKEETFMFLQDVFDEVMQLFPSEYIHIGGDEADKTNWKKCERCQHRMKDEGLKDENELQSYFVSRIVKYLIERGKHPIGWDEILEGGLAPGAIVMSWRGEEGGIEAARLGHQVIMTPGTHCYFDYYQGDPNNEPLTIGGYTPLSKVYSFEPIPEVLTPEQGKLILGAQANHWAEFMNVPADVEYMAFPRLSALSEVLWSPKEIRNWDSFARRMPKQYKRYESRGLNVSRSAYQVQSKTEAAPDKKAMNIFLFSELPNVDIRYTTNGSKPNAASTLFKEPFTIEKTTTVKAATFDGSRKIGQTISNRYFFDKGFGAEISLKNEPEKQYSSSGKSILLDGIIGSVNFSDQKWLGFRGKDLDAVIDLRKREKVSQITVYTLHNSASWIMAPQEATVEISNDGQHYVPFGNVVVGKPNGGARQIVRIEAQGLKKSGRYLRIKVKNYGPLPEGHSGAGEAAWLFVSEIVVE